MDAGPPRKNYEFDWRSGKIRTGVWVEVTRVSLILVIPCLTLKMTIGNVTRK